jgi:hypothetical protein
MGRPGSSCSINRLHGAVFLQKLMVAQLVKKFPVLCACSELPGLNRITFTIHKASGLLCHVDEDLCLLGCDFCREVSVLPTFRRNVLPLTVLVNGSK